MTVVAAAAQFPQGDQYIYIGSHVVFGYLIRNQTLNRTREEEEVEESRAVAHSPF